MQKEISDIKQIKTGSCIHLLERHLKLFLNQEKNNRTKIHLTFSLLEVKGLVIQDIHKIWKFLQELPVRVINTPGRRSGATSKRLVFISS